MKKNKTERIIHFFLNDLTNNGIKETYYIIHIII
jgi:hypothetical protein